MQVGGDTFAGRAKEEEEEEEEEEEVFREDDPANSSSHRSQSFGTPLITVGRGKGRKHGGDGVGRRGHLLKLFPVLCECIRYCDVCSWLSFLSLAMSNVSFFYILALLSGLIACFAPRHPLCRTLCNIFVFAFVFVLVLKTTRSQS
jgi:hypothetical protein